MENTNLDFDDMSKSVLRAVVMTRQESHSLITYQICIYDTAMTEHFNKNNLCVSNNYLDGRKSLRIDGAILFIGTEIRNMDQKPNND